MTWIWTPLAVIVLACLVHADGALEGTVHGVAAQQAGALDQVVLGALADHDRAQAQAVAAAGLFDQEAGQQAADAAETVEHDVGAGPVVRAAAPDNLGKLGAEELFQGRPGPSALYFSFRRAMSIAAAPSSSSARVFSSGAVSSSRQLVLAHPAREAVGFQDVHGGLVDQAAPVDAGHHVVFTVQPADHRNHGLGERFAAHPRIKTRI